MVTALRQYAGTFGSGIEWKLGFVVLVYLDLVLTLVAIQLGFNEVNPLMVRFLSRPEELIIIKVILPPIIAWLIPARLLAPSLAFMLLVAGWNGAMPLASV